MPRDYTIEDADGNERVLPTGWEICGSCDGHGKSSAYLGAITEADRERDWDEDEFAEYMRGGYDRPCDECNGTGKVKVVDVKALTDEEREAWEGKCAEDDEYRAECESERRYGC